MDQQDQLNSVVVNINMDATETDSRFVVQEVTAQSGRCFEGVENLHRARFQCLGCKIGHVVLPLIMQTAPIRTEMEVTIAENDPARIQEIAENFTEDETVSSLVEVVDSDEEHAQDDGHEDSVKEAHMTFPMEVDPDPVENPRSEQIMDSEESDDLTPSKERSLKLQCLRSKVVVRLVRVDEEAREEDASVAPIEPQKWNVKGGFYTCDICKASIKHRFHLLAHMNIHLGIRFSCSECLKSFSQKTDLARHKKRFHQSEFRICEVCKRSKTCTKAEYYSHLRRRHPEFHIKGRRAKVENFNGVDFPCVYCEPKLTFESFEELEDHLEVTHDRNFACTCCPKAWTEQSHLKRHIESVHEKKTFTCPKCDKVFTWKTNFYAHLHNHE